MPSQSLPNPYSDWWESNWYQYVDPQSGQLRPDIDPYADWAKTASQEQIGQVQTWYDQTGGVDPNSAGGGGRGDSFGNLST